MCLTDLPRSRQGFIDDRSKKYFGYEEWISEKTLSNYENGKNIPSLENIRNLSIALEIDELEFVKEILDLL
ncbi:MAG: helix-turn-helix domain-containing protein [Streptococcus salivarius]